MKKFMMLAIAGLFFSTAKAQVGQNLHVTNNTNCQVHFMITGDYNSNCNDRFISTIYSVGPNSSVGFTANNLFWSGQTLSTGDDIVGAYIYDGDPNICGGAAVVSYIGDSGCTNGSSGTTSSGFTPLSILTCTSLGCTGVVATWGTNGVDPTLDFN